jgi:hypothetical protein
MSRRTRRVLLEEPAAGNLHGGVCEGGDPGGAMVDLNGHEAGNGGHSQGKPTAYRDSSTRREAMLRQLCVETGRWTYLASTPFCVIQGCGYELQVFKDAANCNDG